MSCVLLYDYMSSSSLLFVLFSFYLQYKDFPSFAILHVKSMQASCPVVIFDLGLLLVLLSFVLQLEDYLSSSVLSGCLISFVVLTPNISVLVRYWNFNSKYSKMKDPNLNFKTVHHRGVWFFKICMKTKVCIILYTPDTPDFYDTFFLFPQFNLNILTPTKVGPVEFLEFCTNINIKPFQ